MPASSIQHPSSMQQHFPLCTHPVICPLLCSHLLPHLFFLHTCVMGATPKSMVPLPPSRFTLILLNESSSSSATLSTLSTSWPPLHATYGLSHTITIRPFASWWLEELPSSDLVQYLHGHQKQEVDTKPSPIPDYMECILGHKAPYKVAIEK